jgi:hypothetical protein
MATRRRPREPGPDAGIARTRVAPLDLRSPYDVISEPIALVATERGRLILAKILMPANDLKELIARLKANPGQGFAGKHRPRGFTHSGFSWPSGCGIEDIITRPDLADRAILLMLAPIAERQRRPEAATMRRSATSMRRRMTLMRRRETPMR